MGPKQGETPAGSLLIQGYDGSRRDPAIFPTDINEGPMTRPVRPRDSASKKGSRALRAEISNGTISRIERGNGSLEHVPPLPGDVARQAQREMDRLRRLPR